MESGTWVLLIPIFAMVFGIGLIVKEMQEVYAAGKHKDSGPLDGD